MLWLILTLAAAFLWAIVNILDKHIVCDELKDPKLCSMIYGMVFFIFTTIAAFIFKISFVFNIVSAFAIAGGVLATIAVLFYYDSLEEGDVSKVVALFLLVPLFVLFFSFIFLGETFGLKEYIGLFLLMVGTVIISAKRARGEAKLKKYFFLTISTVILFAVRDVLIRYASLNYNIIQILFWVGVGSLINSMFLLISEHEHLIMKAREREGIEHLILSAILSVLAFIAFSKAISLTRVALVSTLINVKVFIVLIIAIVLSRYNPKIIKEHMERSSLERKVIGIILLFIGATLIVI